jgi:hypothetical protein
MDKSFGTLYNKITSLFHSNPSTSSAVPEASSPLPIANFLDRIAPTTITCSSINQRRSSSRMFHQVSIKTNDNRIKLLDDLPQQQM